jgi:flagellar biosynthesis protein FlhA
MLTAQEAAVPVAVLGIVIAMIVPLPPFLVDLLISANIAVSTVVLLATLSIQRPSEFSLFPSTLLLMTLFRLALNVSSSRLILLNGAKGTTAAGEVIEAFGSFVVGGNFIVGIVVFLLLIAIQYVVINHGAVRISEVTARFTLDALPGKQMSIDADLNAGLIDETEARTRRSSLAAEAEFYGAMDGATRFTQRDAIASILITFINIVAGFLIGTVQHGLSLSEALRTYTVLTVGDGLVTVIPALLISVSGGLIVTRGSSKHGIGQDFHHQLFGSAKTLTLAGSALLCLAVLPGLPKVPFIAMGAGLAVAGWRMSSLQKPEGAPHEPHTSKTAEAPEPNLRVDPISLEVGLGLVGWADKGVESPLLRRISSIRKQIALELGFVLPSVRICDNLALKAREYVVKIRGAEIGRFELLAGHDLAVTAGPLTSTTRATPAKEPAFGMTAYWVPLEDSEAVSKGGATVVDPLSVLGTHLAELMRRHAHELFTRQDAKSFLDRVAEEAARAVEDLVPKVLPMVVVQRVLQNLLRERVSIRDGVTIVESLGEAASMTRNATLLTEYVRQGLRRAVVGEYVRSGGELPAFFIASSLELEVERGIEHSEHGSHLNASPGCIRGLLDAASARLGDRASQAIVLTSSNARFFIRQILEPHFPLVTVLSHADIPHGVRLVRLGLVGGDA